MRAFGSDKVLDRMKTWRDIVRTMRALDIQIRAADGGQPDARRDFDGLRAQEVVAREALGDQVAVDLGHR